MWFGRFSKEQTQFGLYPHMDKVPGFPTLSGFFGGKVLVIIATIAMNNSVPDAIAMGTNKG